MVTNWETHWDNISRKKLNFLYTFSGIVGKEPGLGKILQRTAHLITGSLQYVELGCPCIIHAEQEFKMNTFCRTGYKLADEVITRGGPDGVIEGSYSMRTLAQPGFGAWPMAVEKTLTLLKVWEKSVYTMGQSGSLPRFKVSGRWRFRCRGNCVETGDRVGKVDSADCEKLGGNC